LSNKKARRVEAAGVLSGFDKDCLGQDPSRKAVVVVMEPGDESQCHKRR